MTLTVGTRKRRILLGLVLVLLSEVSSASAADWLLDLDQEVTEITFELGATLHTVRGTARLRQGRVLFDPAAGSASGRIVVDAKSLSTGNERRDRVMHKKVLDSLEFPEIWFTPELMRGRFEPSGESRLTVEGAFYLRGAEHPLTVEVVTRTSEASLSAELEFTIPYVAWGVEDPSRVFLRVAKEVKVRVVAGGNLTERTSAGGVTE